MDEVTESIFADGGARFCAPEEPDAGDEVTLSIRVFAGASVRFTLLLGSSPAILMRKVRTEGLFDVYAASFLCPNEPLSYVYGVEYGGKTYRYDRLGLHEGEGAPFRLVPNFHVPAWAKGAMQYQIFPDRFRNGDPSNDVCDNEYYYVSGHAEHAAWDERVGGADIRRHYGGDLAGIREKLDYLQSLGVEVLYLNPIFVSPSSHKYDVQDYDHIDPHLAVIVSDCEHSMQDWEKHNGYAPRYIRRVTAPQNLAASDAYFADFCREVHARGMRLILDGVFNHCGSFCKWMDREGVYLGKEGYAPGACFHPESPYREFFAFSDGENVGNEPLYEGWWGYVTLPKLCYEASEKLCETVLAIAEKWAKPPYGIDGWRLDVAADLGHSEAFNHAFWKRFRARLKAVNPNLLLVAEHYGDPSPWLGGDEWDTVMNYDAFMEPISYFLTGMEKHSDASRPDLRGNGEAFFASYAKASAALPRQSLACAMNQISNHDHSRFLTRTNRRVGRLESAGSEAAEAGVRFSLLYAAILMQMTLPGAPTVYYGDEAGLCGWTDPDCRRPYPWGHEKGKAREIYGVLARLRNEKTELKNGSFKPICGGENLVVYARFEGGNLSIVAVNIGEEEREVMIDLRTFGVEGRSTLRLAVLTSEDGFRIDTDTRTSENASLALPLPPDSAGVWTVG